MMNHPPDVERAERAAAAAAPPTSQADPGPTGGADDSIGARGPQHTSGPGWPRHGGPSPLVAPGLCSPLAMMIMGIDDDDDDEDDRWWQASSHHRRGPFTANEDDDEESKLESAAASSFALPVTYCEPVEDLLFDRSPPECAGGLLPPPLRNARKEKRVRFALDYHDEIPMTTRTTTDEILLAAAAAAAAEAQKRTSPILSNPCLSPSVVPISPAKKEGSASPATGEPASDVDGNAVPEPLPSETKQKNRRRMRRRRFDDSTKDRYVMGKEEQPTWARRNRTALVLIALGLTLICAVAVPLATLRSSSSSPPPASAGGSNRTGDNATSSSSLNGTWSGEDDQDYNQTHGNRTDDKGSTERKCFESNGELRAAIDTWLWASKLREEQQETPQALYELAGTYGWPMNNWCTGNVTNMSHLISVERNPLAANFDQNISRWDVGNVRDFSHLFLGAASFTHDVSRWRVARAVRMDGMFRNATAFSHSLCEWGRRLVVGDRGSGAAEFSVSVEQMFRGTACLTEADPDLAATPISPLCAPCSSDDDDAR